MPMNNLLGAINLPKNQKNGVGVAFDRTLHSLTIGSKLSFYVFECIRRTFDARDDVGK